MESDFKTPPATVATTPPAEAPENLSLAAMRAVANASREYTVTWKELEPLFRFCSRCGAPSRRRATHCTACSAFPLSASGAMGYSGRQGHDPHSEQPGLSLRRACGAAPLSRIAQCEDWASLADHCVQGRVFKAGPRR
ncbi:hypothetical protein MRX96_024185 [Rhipicephalus microplus]